MIKSVKIGNVVNRVLTFTAGIYLLWALAFAFGIVNISPFFANGAILGGALIASAKGAGAIKKWKVEGSIHEALTKGGKQAFALVLPRETANEVKMEINSLLAFSGASLFPWPTQNPDKDKFIAFGFMPANKFVVENYMETGNFDVLGAKKHGEQVREERDAAKADKKATKGTSKTGSDLAAKFAALKDMRDGGLLTEEEYKTKALALIG